MTNLPHDYRRLPPSAAATAAVADTPKEGSTSQLHKKAEQINTRDARGRTRLVMKAEHMMCFALLCSSIMNSSRLVKTQQAEYLNREVNKDLFKNGPKPRTKGTQTI